MAAVAPDTWTPAVWSPAAVMDMQARLDPVRMAHLADDWQHAVDRIGDILVELDGRVSAQIERSWRGRGADASADALRRYVAGSLAGITACRSAAVHLGELSTAAGDLRAAGTPYDLNEALAHVRQFYSAPAVAAGNAVEHIPAPPDPFQLAGQPAASTLPTGAPPAGPTMGTVQSSAAPTDPMPISTLDPARRGIAPPAAGPDPWWRAPTHSAALSSPLDEPLPVRPDPFPATTIPPSPAMPPNAPGPSPNVASLATPPAAIPFMGGMYPGHAGRDGGGEHRAPRYLVSAGNSNELIGELPLVAPPVIGE